MIDAAPRDIDRQVQVLVSTDPAEAPATREHLRGLVDAGVTRIVLVPLPPWPQDVASRLADNIIAPLE